MLGGVPSKRCPQWMNLETWIVILRTIQNAGENLLRENVQKKTNFHRYFFPNFSYHFYTSITWSHCSKLEIVLNENDTPQNQQFLLVYTLVLSKESRLQKPVDIQG